MSPKIKIGGRHLYKPVERLLRGQRNPLVAWLGKQVLQNERMKREGNNRECARYSYHYPKRRAAQFLYKTPLADKVRECGCQHKDAGQNPGADGEPTEDARKCVPALLARAI